MSTCIADYSYSPELEELTITFQKRGTYLYYGVSEDEFKDLILAGSQGSVFNSYIKEYKHYVKIS